jgi:hypothetical protein
MKKLVILLMLLWGGKCLAGDELLRTRLVGSSTYKAGIGLRGGFASGITFKYFFDDHSAIEVIATPGYRKGTWITGLYEYHVEAFGISGLNWYYGGGGHFGALGSSAAVGIDGILGLEYKIFEVPFTLGVDVKPMLNFNYTPALLVDGAFSLRFAF